MDNSKVLPINPSTFELEDYSFSDENLISQVEVNTLFNPKTDYIEYFIYNPNQGGLIFPGPTEPADYNGYTLKDNILNPVQELIILEVALRVINADHIHDENEIKFINLIRAQLRLHDEEIVGRFGELDILHTSSHLGSVVKGQSNNEFFENLRLPKIDEIEEIDFNLE